MIENKHSCPSGQLQLGICGIFLLLAVSLLWLDILKIFFCTTAAVWYLQVCLGIFWLCQVTHVLGKTKMFWATLAYNIPQHLADLRKPIGHQHLWCGSSFWFATMHIYRLGILGDNFTQPAQKKRWHLFHLRTNLQYRWVLPDPNMLNRNWPLSEVFSKAYISQFLLLFCIDFYSVLFVWIKRYPPVHRHQNTRKQFENDTIFICHSSTCFVFTDLNTCNTSVFVLPALHTPG